MALGKGFYDKVVDAKRFAGLNQTEFRNPAQGLLPVLQGPGIDVKRQVVAAGHRSHPPDVIQMLMGQYDSIQTAWRDPHRRETALRLTAAETDVNQDARPVRLHITGIAAAPRGEH
jgi:hypothetical protein